MVLGSQIQQDTETQVLGETVIAAPQVRNSSLPATGSNVLQWVFVAVLLVVGGVVMLLITRRQRVF